MTQSPLSPLLAPSAEFVQNYIDSLENLPLDIQRHVTRLREYDILYKNVMEQVGRHLVLYRNADTGPIKKKYLTKVQKCLVSSQQYGDEKLNIISQIVEMIETRTQQLSRDAQRLEIESSEESKTNSQTIATTNYRMKMEKGVKIPEKPKSVYEKPKRQPRRARVNEKVPEKSTEKTREVSRYVEKEELEEEEIEDDEMEEEPEEPPEAKVKKELKRKPEKTAKAEKEKEKEKEKVKEEKEDHSSSKKEERKSTGKVTKKSATPKQVSGKMKKKRKKEKESTIEDAPVDPDEPTYCICQSISYGDMIGCDNDDCEIEWFHFGCVNLTHKPKGKWYCPRCSAERKENKGKK